MRHRNSLFGDVTDILLRHLEQSEVSRAELAEHGMVSDTTVQAIVVGRRPLNCQLGLTWIDALPDTALAGVLVGRINRALANWELSRRADSLSASTTGASINGSLCAAMKHVGDTADAVARALDDGLTTAGEDAEIQEQCVRIRDAVDRLSRASAASVNKPTNGVRNGNGRIGAQR